MNSDKLIRILRFVLPSPFTIAVGLTAVAFSASLLYGVAKGENTFTHWLDLTGIWANGLWSPSLLVFAMQMMLMLVFGHTLALSGPIDRFISKVIQSFCKNGPISVYIVTLLTIVVALYNWGLGLIFGAIFARKVGEHAVRTSMKLNYGLLGAAGYSGLMVWHGGFSGSSLAKVAESGHLKELSLNRGLDEAVVAQVPDFIGYGQTVFSPMNLSTSFLLVISLPLLMYWVARRTCKAVPVLSEARLEAELPQAETGAADKLDQSRWIALAFGSLIFFTALYQAWIHPGFGSLNFINPNWINLSLLGLGIVFHGNFSSFLKAIDQAIGGASGILIQFPLYFGVMALMSESGLIQVISSGFVSLCEGSSFPDKLYPILTFISAGIVNIFVPSGGGQWAIQGPIIVQGAAQLDLPLAKSILAMAYGDQLTNMLQPFWALPLLGITGLKAREILPYTLLLMLAGAILFLSILILF